MSRIDEMIQQLCPDGVEYKKLGALGNFYGGLSGKSKDDFAEGNALFVPYTNVYNNAAVDLSDLSPVRVSDDERQHEIHRGDVLITGSSETPDDCGMTSVVMEEPDGKLYLNSFCFGWRPSEEYAEKFEPGFLKHVMRAHEARKQIVRTANGVTRFNISKKSFSQVEIPVPPLDIQREVVRVLDSFAELEARKAQYAYYRNKLLTFDNIEMQRERPSMANNR